MKNNRKGFTLAELLIVVAIIAVLVAIAIPVFNGSLERAKQSTDAANIRAAYAEAMVDYLGNGATAAVNKETVNMQSGSWDKLPDLTEIGGVPKANISKTKDKPMVVAIDTSGTVTITAKTA